MVIKVILEDDFFITKINGDLETIAKYYFPRKEVKEIEILEGGIFENEYFRKTPLKIYRVLPEKIEKFNLFNNIRYTFKIEYFKNQAENEILSCGLCRI